jgi:hypothetical protein
MQQDYWGGANLQDTIPARGRRPQQKKSAPFIDWTNEFEAVLDHVAMLKGNLEVRPRPVL